MKPGSGNAWSEVWRVSCAATYDKRHRAIQYVHLLAHILFYFNGHMLLSDLSLPGLSSSTAVPPAPGLCTQWVGCSVAPEPPP